MDKLINIKVLTDRELTPVDKVIYLGLASKTDRYGKSTLKRESLELMVQVNQEGQVAQLSTARIDEAIEKLIKGKYITKDFMILLSDEKEVAQNAIVDYILEYLSNARMVRGYSTRPMTGEGHRKNIRSRVREGMTVDEAIAVINYRFESDWHKQHHRYLVPTTLFQKTKYEDVLAEIEDIEEWSSGHIHKYGLSKTSDVDREESVGRM